MRFFWPFFSTRAKENKKTELVIFITPTIITESGNVAHEEKDAKK
jgi:type II secretory pathway component GspD/PulD (secretin)